VPRLRRHRFLSGISQFISHPISQRCVVSVLVASLCYQRKKKQLRLPTPIFMQRNQTTLHTTLRGLSLRANKRRLSAKLVQTFADRRRHVVSVTSLGPYSRFSRPEPILFLPRTTQLYSRGWVDPVPDPLSFRKSGSAGNRILTFGSIARNSVL
jgi:hypothetical protein